MSDSENKVSYAVIDYDRRVGVFAQDISYSQVKDAGQGTFNVTISNNVNQSSFYDIELTLYYDLTGNEEGPYDDSIKEIQSISIVRA
jgi:hypothetical protein